MSRARVNRLAASVAGAGLLLGGFWLVRVSRLAAPKGMLFVGVGVLLLIVAAWPASRR